ncbi:MAG: hypothetical protein ACQEW2_17630 [Bacillota bacterium]
MKKIKAVAYFATLEHEDNYEFFSAVDSYIQEQNNKNEGFEQIQLTATFHDLNIRDDYDHMPAWEQFLTFLVVNKDVSHILLPKSHDGVNFKYADCLSDLREFMDIPLVTSWFIYQEYLSREELARFYGYDFDDENEVENDELTDIRTSPPEEGYLDISDDDLPF